MNPRTFQVLALVAMAPLGLARSVFGCSVITGYAWPLPPDRIGQVSAYLEEHPGDPEAVAELARLRSGTTERGAACDTREAQRRLEEEYRLVHERLSELQQRVRSRASDVERCETEPEHASRRACLLLLLREPDLDRPTARKALKALHANGGFADLPAIELLLEALPAWRRGRVAGDTALALARADRCTAAAGWIMRALSVPPDPLDDVDLAETIVLCPAEIMEGPADLLVRTAEPWLVLNLAQRGVRGSYAATFEVALRERLRETPGNARLAEAVVEITQRRPDPERLEALRGWTLVDPWPRGDRALEEAEISVRLKDSVAARRRLELELDRSPVNFDPQVVRRLAELYIEERDAAALHRLAARREAQIGACSKAIEDVALLRAQAAIVRGRFRAAERRVAEVLALDMGGLTGGADKNFAKLVHTKRGTPGLIAYLERNATARREFSDRNGWIAFRLGEFGLWKEALPYLREQRDWPIRGGVRFEFLRYAARAGAWSEAEATLRQELVRIPSWQPIALDLAEILLRRGAIAEAEQTVIRSFELRVPGQVVAALWLAARRHARGDQAGAAEIMAKAEQAYADAAEWRKALDLGRSSLWAHGGLWRELDGLRLDGVKRATER